jgi:hypothetical protein
MNRVSVSIPYLVLSTKQNLDGRLEVYTLTPFGRIDISFSATSVGPSNRILFDIDVESDINTWMLDHSLPKEFREAILRLIGEIVVQHSGRSVYEIYALRVNYKDQVHQIDMAGYIGMGTAVEKKLPLGENHHEIFSAN